MFKQYLNQKGFTLVEMLVVLMIISILLLIAIPSMTKNNEVASSKGCEATVKLIQAQVYAYEIEENEALTSLDELVNKGYVESLSCPNGTKVNFKASDKIVTSPSS